MKPIHAAILFMAGLLTLINSPLQAQEKPSANTNPNSAEETPLAEPPSAEAQKEKEKADAKEKEKDKNRDKPKPQDAVSDRGTREQPRPDQPRPDQPRPDKPRPDAHHRQAHAKPGEKPTAFIGVLTRPASPELRAQLGLQDGFGLQVVEVMPGSPAQNVGLKEHDVLVNFDDQKLAAMEQLQALVRSKKKGDQATLEIISGGQRSQVTITMDERMMPQQSAEEGRRPMGQFFHHRPQRGDSGDRMRGRPSLDSLQSRLREYQERLQEWSRNGNRGPMPPPPMMDDIRQPRGEGDHRPDATPRSAPRPPEGPGQRNISVTRRDDSGLYTLRQDGDKKTFTVHPKGGSQQQWSFTDSERDMVPEEYRDNLRTLESMANDMRPKRSVSDPGRKPMTRDGDKPRDLEAPREGGRPPEKRGETF